MVRIEIGDIKKGIDLQDCSVDAVVTDPPYELTSNGSSKKGFMGKAWDGSGVAFDVAVWREVLRVLKPGGHLLSFGGTRTYHRMACAIEDAGFEIRDCIDWIYGSGFPKSLDISKAIDKVAGVERVVVGEATRWNGWGTALKPAHESIVVASKPLDSSSMMAMIGSWLSLLCASVAGETSASSRAESNDAHLGFAALSAEPRSVTPGASFVPTDTLRCELGTVLNWNIVQSWQNIWAEVYGPTNTCTTSTETRPTTELRTLWSCLWLLMQAITPPDLTQIAASIACAERVDACFRAEHAKWKCTQTLSALALATSQNLGRCRAEADSHEPIVVARKPLSEKTVAANVLKHNTGGINVDACRVALDAGARVSGVQRQQSSSAGDFGAGSLIGREIPTYNTKGRWPPNVLLTHDPSCTETECVEGCPVEEMGRQSGIRPGMSGGGKHAAGYVGGMFGSIDCEHTARDDTGTAARFFPAFRYVSKASTREREAGCEGLPATSTRHNIHPTVKPIELMRWLVRLVTPPGGTVLDPFMGSGTTGCACALEGFDFIGFDVTPEYVEIAKVRMQATRKV